MISLTLHSLNYIHISLTAVLCLRSLVISIFLYACESCTLTAELEKRTQAFEMRCNRRLLNISYKDHVTNEEVRRKIKAAIGEYDELLTLVKKRKLRWFGHVSRSSGLAKTILQGTVKGKRKGGRQNKRWEDNIKEWTGTDFASSTKAAENRSRWKGIVANLSVVPRRPPKVALRTYPFLLCFLHFLLNPPVCPHHRGREHLW